MSIILLDGLELEVTEDPEEVLVRIVNSRDGLRLGSGAIIAPPGWVSLTDSGSGNEVYVQVSRIGLVR
jgi:hypothetical protein